MDLREELDRVLGPGGAIARNHPRYEHRPGQIRMAQAIGAATRRMSMCQVAYTANPAMTARGMLVNGWAQRFHNEDTYPGLWSEAAIREPGKVWVIMDETGFEEVPPMDGLGLQPAFAAETIEELAEEIGLDPRALAQTVENYNAGARAGKDALGKDPSWLRELTGPFAAFDPAKGLSPYAETPPESTGYAGFTLGGLHTTLDAEVLQRLYDTGCRYVTFAPESGSERMLEVFDKRVKLPVVLRSLEAAHRIGIRTRVNVIIGHPEERWRDLLLAGDGGGAALPTLAVRERLAGH